MNRPSISLTRFLSAAILAAVCLLPQAAEAKDKKKAKGKNRDAGQHHPGGSERDRVVYHSHPRSSDPAPSETDVRLAYYPAAVYFIVGLGGEEPCLRAFRIG